MDRCICLTISIIFESQGWLNHTKPCSLCTFIHQKHGLMNRCSAWSWPYSEYYNFQKAFSTQMTDLNNYFQLCIINARNQLIFHLIESSSFPSLPFRSKKKGVLQITSIYISCEKLKHICKLIPLIIKEKESSFCLATWNCLHVGGWD